MAPVVVKGKRVAGMVVPLSIRQTYRKQNADQKKVVKSQSSMLSMRSMSRRSSVASSRGSISSIEDFDMAMSPPSPFTQTAPPSPADSVCSVALVDSFDQMFESVMGSGTSVTRHFASML